MSEIFDEMDVELTKFGRRVALYRAQVVNLLWHLNGRDGHGNLSSRNHDLQQNQNPLISLRYQDDLKEVVSEFSDQIPDES
jgi:hypothetical protein